MELNGKIIGSIIFLSAKLTSKDKIRETLTIGPFCIAKAYQAKGYGRILMNEALKLAKELGYEHVFLYGYPEIYSKLNFKQAGLYRIGPAKDVYPIALHVFELAAKAFINEATIFTEDFFL